MNVGLQMSHVASVVTTKMFKTMGINCINFLGTEYFINGIREFIKVIN
jgi:hypothetical protein